MQLIPKPGQLLWYVDLSQVRSRSLSEVLELLEQMGHHPQLRYLESDGSVSLFALLRDEQYEADQPINDEYLIDDRLALYDAFSGEEDAIHFSTGLPQRVEAKQTA